MSTQKRSSSFTIVFHAYLQMALRCHPFRWQYDSKQHKQLTKHWQNIWLEWVNDAVKLMHTMLHSAVNNLTSSDSSECVGALFHIVTVWYFHFTYGEITTGPENCWSTGEHCAVFVHGPGYGWPVQSWRHTLWDIVNTAYRLGWCICIGVPVNSGTGDFPRRPSSREVNALWVRARKFVLPLALDSSFLARMPHWSRFLSRLEGNLD